MFHSLFHISKALAMHVLSRIMCELLVFAYLSNIEKLDRTYVNHSGCTTLAPHVKALLICLLVELVVAFVLLLSGFPNDCLDFGMRPASLVH